ncbi:DUF4245 family protein [Austwickia chelonae]|uniref:DUF4245 family protein n=1 Tax=Austwickia chelonae TaxID=100225 RepID=UPI00138ACEA5|nr:DUF4245 family protein [Austwickia chelonae]
MTGIDPTQTPAPDRGGQPGGGQVSSPDRNPSGSGVASTHGRGSWRSLVISMVVMSLIVFAVVALMPRPMPRERVTVDVRRAADQIRSDPTWPVALVETGDGWHPTLVRHAADSKGVLTWRVGYHRRPDDDRYVVLSQARPGDLTGQGVLDAWLERETLRSEAQDGVEIAGRRWHRRSASIEGGAGERVRRSLTTDAGADGLVTVLSGEVDENTLMTFAAALRAPESAQASPMSR